MPCGFFDVDCPFGGQIRAIIISRNYLSPSVGSFMVPATNPPQPKIMARGTSKAETRKKSFLAIMNKRLPALIMERFIVLRRDM
jgi:hypothetical protein